MILWDHQRRALIEYFAPSPCSPGMFYYSVFVVPVPSFLWTCICHCYAVWSAKFVARKQWVLAGSGDNCIRVYKWYSLKAIKVISEAHNAAVRCLAVHPTLPYLLSSSDDNTIKLWNWDKDWCCTRVFVGHSASVVKVTFNPKDTNSFASALLDYTTKVGYFVFVHFIFIIQLLEELNLFPLSRYGVLVLWCHDLL